MVWHVIKYLACDKIFWHMIILPVGRLSWQCPNILKIMIRSVEVIWEGGNGRDGVCSIYR